MMKNNKKLTGLFTAAILAVSTLPAAAAPKLEINYEAIGRQLAQQEQQTAAANPPAPKESNAALYWSYGALTGASTLDVVSSLGKYEANGLLDDNGMFTAKSAAIKYGITAGMMFGEHMIVKREPDSKKAFTILNYVISAALTAVAIRNFQIPRPDPR